jgi:hypothetical protein
MARLARNTQPIAMSQIVHGRVGKDGKNEVVVFNVGEEVTGLDDATFKTLSESGAIKRLAPETPTDETPIA